MDIDIDNGFGAGYQASLINHMATTSQQSRQKAQGASRD